MKPLALLVLMLAATSAAARETDPRTGLVVDDGWIFVNAHCGGCHSHALVTSQRGDAGFWLSTIRWMQRTQKLWQIPEDQEQQIIAYLAKHYSESDWGRRPPLPLDLMPERNTTSEAIQ